MPHDGFSKSPGGRTGERTPVGQWALVGLVLALAVLSKLSGLALLAMAAIVIALAAWHRGSWRYAWQAGLSLGTVVLALAGWWYARNLVLYGEPTGLTAMWEVVGRRTDFGQDLWGEFRALRYSFWGLFGWFSIALPGWVYRVLDVFSLLSLSGLGIEVARWWSHGLWRGAWSAFRYREPSWGAAFRPLGFGLLVLWLGTVLISLVRWTSLTPGTQGRLVFPALSTIALLLVLGLRVWFLWRVRDAAMVVLVLGLVVLAVLVPFLWIAPAYAGLETVDRLPADAILVDLSFEETVVLRGVRLGQPAVRAGDSLRADLYWQALGRTSEMSQTMVVMSLFGELGGFVGVEDSYPGGGTMPVSLWPVGPLLAGRQYIRIGHDVDAPLVARVNVTLSDRTGAVREPSTVARIKVIPQRWPAVGRREAVARLLPEGTGEGLVLARFRTAETVRAGEAFSVELVWKVHSPPGQDYSVFVHLEDGVGNVYGFGDSSPREGRYPTSAWAAEEVVVDMHEVQVDPATPAGHYRLLVGMYDDDGRVPAHEPSGTRWLHDAIHLGMVEVP